MRSKLLDLLDELSSLSPVVVAFFVLEMRMEITLSFPLGVDWMFQLIPFCFWGLIIDLLNSMHQESPWDALLSTYARASPQHVPTVCIQPSLGFLCAPHTGTSYISASYFSPWSQGHAMDRTILGDGAGLSHVTHAGISHSLCPNSPSWNLNPEYISILTPRQHDSHLGLDTVSTISPNHTNLLWWIVCHLGGNRVIHRANFIAFSGSNIKLMMERHTSQWFSVCQWLLRKDP